MSLTLCREYCQGQNALLFGTSDIICNCYLTEPTHYSKEGECLLPCVGADTQPCGGTLSDGTNLFSLFRLGKYKCLLLCHSQKRVNDSAGK